MRFKFIFKFHLSFKWKSEATIITLPSRLMKSHFSFYKCRQPFLTNRIIFQIFKKEIY